VALVAGSGRREGIGRYLLVGVHGRRVLSQVVEPREPPAAVTHERTLAGVFARQPSASTHDVQPRGGSENWQTRNPPYVPGQMFTPGESQITRAKPGAVEFCSFLLLGPAGALATAPRLLRGFETVTIPIVVTRVVFVERAGHSRRRRAPVLDRRGRSLRPEVVRCGGGGSSGGGGGGGGGSWQGWWRQPTAGRGHIPCGYFCRREIHTVYSPERRSCWPLNGSHASAMRGSTERGCGIGECVAVCPS